MTAEAIFGRLHATPATVCDGLAWSLFHELRFDPSKLEQFLTRRGYALEDGTSIRDCLAANYGEEVAEAVEALL